MKILQIFLLLSFLSICGCSHNEASNNAKIIQQLNSGRKFKIEMPERSRIDYLRREEKALGLDSLNNGFDSVQIRFWYGCALGDEKLLVFSNKNGEWVGELSHKEYLLSKTSQRYDSIIRTIDYVSPLSGWERFLGKLFSLHLLTLPDIESIEGFKEESIADGCGVSVEIATKNFYRIYDYHNPDSYEDKYWQAREIMYILYLVNKEFNIRDMWPTHESWFKRYIPTAPIRPKPVEITLQLLPPIDKKKK